MKPKLALHPVSVLLGALLAAVVLLSMSQGPAPTGPRIEYGPHPRDFVQIREGTPLVVPAGKLFVPTALGTDTKLFQNTSWGHLIVNGSVVCSRGNHPHAEWPTMGPIPKGMTFSAGTTIDASATQGSGELGQVWGYLAAAGTGPGAGTAGVRVSVDAPARDYVSISAATPLVVPQGKLFVLTATRDAFLQVFIDGVVVYAGGHASLSGVVTGIGPVPDGCVAHPGSTVTTESNGEAWGYLVAQ